MQPADQCRFTYPCDMRWARVLLIVLAWTGPVPVVHDHGTLANATVCNSAFVEHLAQFHGAIDPEADLHLGWHLHWIWPSDTMPADSSPSQISLAAGIAWPLGATMHLPFHEGAQVPPAETDLTGLIDLAAASQSQLTAWVAHASPIASFACSGQHRSLTVCLSSLRC